MLTLDATEIIYDYEDMKNTFNNYNKKFEAILEMEDLEKLGIDDCGILYRETSMFQSVTRWWYEQGRHRLHTYLDQQFAEYSVFLDMTVHALDAGRNQAAMIKLINDNISFLQWIVI